MSSPHTAKGDRNRLKSVSWEISLTGIELAPLAGAYDLVGVSDHSGPVKAPAERVTHEGTRRRVVATHTHVDVSIELVTLGDGDAPLQDAGCDTLVQLTVDDSE
jgi:hypothetical protein